MLRTKKSLGQHFLASTTYVRAVAQAGQVESGDTVLEIGPGEGVLTAELLARGARVVAVEKDARLIPLLRERFAAEISAEELTLIAGDILEMPASALPLADGGYKLIANIPYYITGALFEKFLGHAPRPSTLVFLVQKEVAERIARAKKESILSLSVKAYGTPRYVRTVPRGAFRPAPAVDSAILAVADISGGNFESGTHEKRFFALVHAGFAHKRKLLARNLEVVLGARARERLARAGIPEKSRAEDVPLAQWLALSKEN